MSEFPLDRPQLEALKKKHVAFLRQRLVSNAARNDWERSLPEGHAWALGLRVGDILDPQALTDRIVRALTTPSTATLFFPVARDLHRRVLASMKSDMTRLGEYVPDEARAAIDELLERSDLVPERLIRNIFDQDAIEDTIRDVLYDGLREFNETVNPFFADWGLPALLKRMPIGGGTLLKSMGAMRGEFDKRLEPEIRKFLLVFSRKAKGKVADLFIKQGQDPKFIELRKSVVLFLYSQSVTELLAGIDTEANQKAEMAAEAILVRALAERTVRTRLHESIHAFLEEHKDRTVADVLASVGATGEPDFGAWAELTWPLLKGLLESPIAVSFFEKLTHEFYDALAGS